MILFQTNCMPWSLKDNHQSLSFSIFAGHGNLCDCFSPKVTLFKKFDLKLNILTKNILRDATFRVFMTRLEVENDTFYAQSVSFCLEVNEGSLSKRTKVFLKILIRVWDSFRDMLNLLLIVTILVYFKLQSLVFYLGDLTLCCAQKQNNHQTFQDWDEDFYFFYNLIIGFIQFIIPLTLIICLYNKIRFHIR